MHDAIIVYVLGLGDEITIAIDGASTIDCLLRIPSGYPDKAAQMSIALPLVLWSVNTPFSSTV